MEDDVRDPLSDDLGVEESDDKMSDDEEEEEDEELVQEDGE